MCRSTSALSLWVWMQFFPNYLITVTCHLAQAHFVPLSVCDSQGQRAGSSCGEYLYIRENTVHHPCDWSQVPWDRLVVFWMPRCFLDSRQCGWQFGVIIAPRPLSRKKQDLLNLVHRHCSFQDDQTRHVYERVCKCSCTDTWRRPAKWFCRCIVIMMSTLTESHVRANASWMDDNPVH